MNTSQVSFASTRFDQAPPRMCSGASHRGLYPLLIKKYIPDSQASLEIASITVQKSAGVERVAMLVYDASE
jgi:hypothetical protein